MAQPHGGEHEGEGVSPIAVERYLKGIDFPATKDDLIQHAQENDAPNDVLGALDRFDDRPYSSVADIAREVSKVR